MSFTTIDNVKLMLGKSTLTTMETAQLQMLIGMIDGVINNYCGWNLLETAYTDVNYTGNDTSILDLGVYPVVTLTKVYDVTNSLDIKSLVTCSLLDGVLTYASSTFSSASTYQLSFTAGLAANAIPQDLSYAASYLTVIQYNRIADDSVGVEERKFNNISVKYDAEDIPKLVKRVLDRYRKISIF